MQLPLLDRFEKACADAKVEPTAVLRAANIHPSLWSRWKTRKVSPTLRKFEAAVVELEKMGGVPCDCGSCKPRKSKNGAR